MGQQFIEDLALARSWGYPLRDAVRFVARVTLLRAEQGRRYSEEYLRQLHETMVATA
jgi:hypothetical protein